MNVYARKFKFVDLSTVDKLYFTLIYTSEVGNKPLMYGRTHLIRLILDWFFLDWFCSSSYIILNLKLPKYWKVFFKHF